MKKYLPRDPGKLLAMLPPGEFDAVDASLRLEITTNYAHTILSNLIGLGHLVRLNKGASGNPSRFSRRTGSEVGVLGRPKISRPSFTREEALEAWTHISPLLLRGKRILYSDVRKVLPDGYISAVNACFEHELLAYDGMGFVRGEVTATQLGEAAAKERKKA